MDFHKKNSSSCNVSFDRWIFTRKIRQVAMLVLTDGFSREKFVKIIMLVLTDGFSREKFVKIIMFLLTDGFSREKVSYRISLYISN